MQPKELKAHLKKEIAAARRTHRYWKRRKQWDIAWAWRWRAEALEEVLSLLKI